MQHVALHELRQPRQALIEALLEALAVAQEGEVGIDHRLQDADRLGAVQAGAQRAAQVGRTGANADKVEEGIQPNVRQGSKPQIGDPVLAGGGEV